MIFKKCFLSSKLILTVVQPSARGAPFLRQHNCRLCPCSFIYLYNVISNFQPCEKRNPSPRVLLVIIMYNGDTLTKRKKRKKA